MSRFLGLHTWLLLLSWALGTGFGFLGFSYKLRDKYLTSAAKRLHQNQNPQTAFITQEKAWTGFTILLFLTCIFVLKYVRVFWLCVCLCTKCIQWHKRALDSLELELRNIVSCQVGAGTQTPSGRVTTALSHWVLALALALHLEKDF